ncbi:MAG: CDP-diacylglycerol--serine O-phosphatidyltransferase [Acidobacteriota bacterium]|nr:CDP-diacylglycerol--serine O-phosphatidyltransferase [Acidobacteriota bacterium]
MPDLDESSPKQPKKRPPRAAYVLPTLFTAGNIFLGYLSILRTFQGALQFGTNPSQSALDFEVAAKTIGLSVLLDGLDGRIARATNTTSDFGRELDSLADVISFGIAPAILAYVWGVAFVGGETFGMLDQLQRVGKFVAFLFLVCGAMRLARFNIQKNPIPRNPGSPHRKYFVGLAIPAGAGMVASVVYAFDSYPITNFYWSAAWLALLALLSFLMVSTWRYWSFKDLNPLRPRSFILMCAVIFAIWNWSEKVLVAMASAYVLSGVFIRIGGIVRRHLKKRPGRLAGPETQVG